VEVEAAGAAEAALGNGPATVDGPKLTIVTRQEMGGQISEYTQVWALDGSTLTVETTTARGTQKRVYKK
jgi:hypothetical protein